MRRGLAVVVLLVVAAAVWFVVSPILAVRGLGDAIERADASALEERVDFPTVRQGMKDQINAEMLRRSGVDAADNPLGAFAIGIASKLTDGMVDAFVTPSGLALLARGRQPFLSTPFDDDPSPPPAPAPRDGAPDAVPRNAEGDAGDTADPEASRPFADARIDRESFDRFTMRVPDERGGELRFGFRRHGLGWKLEHVGLPLPGGDDRGGPPAP